MPTAIITGASAGIGAGVTYRLLNDNWNVILIARSTDKMKKITSSYPTNKYKIISCDLSKPGLLLANVIPSIQSYLNSINSGIDLLLNNAGGVTGNANEEETIDELLSSFNWHIGLLLATPYLLTEYLSRKDLFNNHASVINIGSIAALHSQERWKAYGMAKRGLEALTKSHAFELATKNNKQIRVNNIEPGFTRTDVLRQGQFPDITPEFEENFWKTMAPFHPLKRCGTVQDIVEFIVFLADNKKSGWITGQSYVIDGGIGLPLFHQRPKL